MKQLLMTTLALMVTATITTCIAADREAKQLSTKALLTLIDKADSAESYRLEPRKTIAGAKKIGRFSIGGKGPALTAMQRKDAAKIIRKTVMDPEMRKFGKGCDPLPGVALVFKSGKRIIEIALCYECEMWQFYLDGQRWQGWENFDSGNKELVKLAKALFPADKAIQGL